MTTFLKVEKFGGKIIPLRSPVKDYSERGHKKYIVKDIEYGE